MVIISKIVLYTIMACCALGAIAKIIKSNSGLAKSFDDGINAMSSLFLPICGLMASVPFIVAFAEKVFGSFFRSFGADPSISAAMIVPADCGGYAALLSIAATPEAAVIGLCVALMMAPTIGFNIPTGLAILQEKDRPYLALGAMSGFLSVPFGVFITCIILIITSPKIRTVLSTTAACDYVLNLHISTVLINLVPVLLLCVLLAVGLWKFPKGMVKGFTIFGKILFSAMILVAASSIIEHYTGIFTKLFGNWGFDPILGDDNNSFRAIEQIGSIAMMLSGTFPMVYLVRKFLGKPLSKAGRLIGLDDVGSAGILAAMANVVALFNVIKYMNPKSKVICISFCVCGGYCLGDFIAFNMNFQPTLVIPIFIGQFCGGIIGIIFSKLIAVKQISKVAIEGN